MFLDVFLGLTLTGPKRASKSTILYNRLNKGKLLIDVANLATCCYDDCDVLLEVWEPCANAMLVVLLPKLWFWIENHHWHKCSWMSSWGSLLLGPKKLQNQQFYIIDWIREKTPGRCCQSGYLLLWWLWCTIGGLGTLRKCYVSSPVAKALVLDWKSWLAHNCFWMSSWGSPLLGPKKLQNQQFYIIDWIRKKTPGQSCQSGYLLPWWLWCTIGGFGNPAQMLC